MSSNTKLPTSNDFSHYLNEDGSLKDNMVECKLPYETSPLTLEELTELMKDLSPSKEQTREELIKKTINK